MHNRTTIGHGTIALYAAADAVFCMAVVLTAIWSGAPLAAIPWVISIIICASIAGYANTAWGPASTGEPAPVTVPIRAVRQEVQPGAGDRGRRRPAPAR